MLQLNECIFSSIEVGHGKNAVRSYSADNGLKKRLIRCQANGKEKRCVVNGNLNHGVVKG